MKMRIALMMMMMMMMMIVYTVCTVELHVQLKRHGPRHQCEQSEQELVVL